MAELRPALSAPVVDEAPFADQGLEPLRLTFVDVLTDLGDEEFHRRSHFLQTSASVEPGNGVLDNLSFREDYEGVQFTTLDDFDDPITTLSGS
jgi:hypothetical protein